MAQNPFNDDNVYPYNEGKSNPFTGGEYGAVTPEQLRLKEEELDRREQQLEYNERRVQDSRSQLKGQKKQPNWPKFKPLIYHNIREEIPESGRLLVKRVYFSWFLTVFALSLNLISLLAAIIGDSATASNGVSFGISIAYFVLGIPVSFVFWYRPFYTAVKNDRSISYFFFFFNYACHLGFCIIMAIGIPSSGGGGFIVAVSVIGRNLGAGIILFISAGSWVFLCFFLLWQIKSAIQYYRKGGHTLKGDSKQVAKDLASTETGQTIIKETGKAAIQEAARSQ